MVKKSAVVAKRLNHGDAWVRQRKLCRGLRTGIGNSELLRSIERVCGGWESAIDAELRVERRQFSGSQCMCINRSFKDSYATQHS